MNKTKKLTQGAMLIAIAGALILIDRITAFFFTELVVLIVPVIIIMYSSMHTVKDGVFLSIGLAIIAFLLGNLNLTYLIYVPVGIVTGLIYSFGVAKGMDKKSIMFLAILTYAIGEIIAMVVVYPLIGFPLKTMIEEYKLALTETGNITGYDFNAMFSSLGNNVDKLLGVIYIISIIFTGAMEGVLIHVLSIFMLKRFKIKDLGRLNLYDIKPNPVLAYVSFISTFSFFLKNIIKNETVFYILIGIGVIGVVILLYYGYIFMVLYGSLVLRRNIAMFVIIMALFMPVVFITLVIIGFLYASGPLRTFLENKVSEIQNQKHE